MATEKSRRAIGRIRKEIWEVELEIICGENWSAGEFRDGNFRLINLVGGRSGRCREGGQREGAPT